MKKFKTIISTVVPLIIDNIDTDQIIPSRFLKLTDCKKYGKYLFIDWRLKEKKFILNNSIYSGNILIVGKNFGCGSSREHAAWSIFDYGFRVLISKSFADIFKENALNNGLLPIEVSESFINDIFFIIKKNPKIKIKVDLNNQNIILLNTNIIEKFYIHPYKKYCFINGYDDIEFLISLKKEITLFEKEKLIYI
ncbi:3-isopropylmalate dehydratase small subunit [Blattabacterium cuenoti]|uniref:3-isopropylmalate dehydratase small subunit n=1 Tax=Blattabacterium cuenoti TaxID=1653831 RepID=UPI00163C0F26|nr:3-isopropylmalate dehydratase small subunit [Blattabacterium cuenoti]